MDSLNCYICNANTKIRTCVRIKSKTKYSGIGIHEIIQRFLKETHTLRFSPNDIVCGQCYRKVNQYDLACRMADEIQKDITSSLYITEQEYLSEEPLQYLEVAHSDAYTCQKEFDELQETFDMENDVDPMPSDAMSEEGHASANTESMEAIEDHFMADIEQESTNAKSRAQISGGQHGCEDCDIPFDTKKELKAHLLQYHKQKKCGVCQQVFANQVEMKAHIRQNHEIDQKSNDETEVPPATDNESNFRCEFCGMCESSADALLAHLEKHENKNKCIICGQIVKHRANLHLHMRIHTDKKFYKCDKCDKTFVHRSSIRMHLQTTHTEIRNKQCPECPLRFKTTSQLNQHLVTHSGIKKHKCPECGKAFGQKYNMTAHHKSHFTNKVQGKPRQQQPTATSDESIDDLIDKLSK